MYATWRLSRTWCRAAVMWCRWYHIHIPKQRSSALYDALLLCHMLAHTYIHRNRTSNAYKTQAWPRHNNNTRSTHVTGGCGVFPPLHRLWILKPLTATLHDSQTAGGRSRRTSSSATTSSAAHLFLFFFLARLWWSQHHTASVVCVLWPLTSDLALVAKIFKWGLCFFYKMKEYSSKNSRFTGF